MQRMELYVSGVRVPRLGSVQDRVLRDYLLKKATKEITLNKLLAFIAISGSQDSKAAVAKVTTLFNDYVNKAYYLEGEEEVREFDMQAELAYWKNIKAKISKDKSGKLFVSGLPKDMVSVPKPTKK